MMAGIRGKNTKPELALRRALHARGFWYRLHIKGIKGKPDLVLPKFRAAVLIHGCFWHRHANCRYATMPSSRQDFWRPKFAANVARDQAVKAVLLESGWRVATIWECALRKEQQVETSADILAQWLATESLELEIGESEAVGIATINSC